MYAIRSYYARLNDKIYHIIHQILRFRFEYRVLHLPSVQTITDMGGKEVCYSTYRNVDTFDINLNVQSGIYLLTIRSGDKRATIRIIKK